MRVLIIILLVALCAATKVLAQGFQPTVAVHDSELTRALESMPASSATPHSVGTTTNEWWTTNWHYFVMPNAVKEALRSDGTAFTVVGDSNITAGVLLSNGLPQYPIVISLASEAIRDDEIAPLTNYVAAGGFLLVGSSAFTRNTNGTTRGDFAFANALGVHMVVPGLTNWRVDNNLTKLVDQRLVSHIPAGTLAWGLPSAAEEISWGISPLHPYLPPHWVWQVQATNATVVARGDLYPLLSVKQFGKGYFIYYAAMQPLIGHGGWAPSMYTYLIFRKAIEWAFESAHLPVAKLSPWPYPYDAAFMVRHDLEDFTNEVANIAASAQFEYTNGAKGDYYFCTGTLREDASPLYNTNAIIGGLLQAITNYGATIGPHNGGLRNPNNASLLHTNYDYWHWGPDEALDASPTNYPSGRVYALTSLSNSFADMESWLGSVTNGLRAWVAPYFNATREESYAIQAELGVNIAGEQKLTPFPHWTLSTRTPDKQYAILSEPVCEWYLNGNIAQDLEPWHPPYIFTSLTAHQAVDFYYGLGALINLYSHTLSTGLGDAGQLTPDYITYSLNTNFHPRLWSANAVGVYQWWVQRSSAQISASYSTNGNESITTVSITGAQDTNTSVEILVPANGSALGLQVLTNSVLATGNCYRTNGQVIKIKVGTSITNTQVRYILGPNAQNDVYTVEAGAALSVAAPGVLGNDAGGLGTNLTAVVLSGPANGALALNTNGGFSYIPSPGFIGTDSFTYAATNEQTNSGTATVVISVTPAGALFADSFDRATDPGPLSPWVAQSGAWREAGGGLRGGPNMLQTYAYACLTNSWTNYSVQARVQFSATNVWGGGIGGRLNPVTGAHYGAWIYPEGSLGGSNILRLIKFQNWTTFAYNGTNAAPMQQVKLSAVGTNWHTVKLAFSGNQIAVYYDTNQVMSVTDVEAQPYASGGLSVDTWTYLTGYTLSVDDVVVSPLVVGDCYSMNQDTMLTNPPPGVLANDSGAYSTNLTAILVTGPANGTLNLSTNGAFTYAPNTNYVGTDSFSYQANDGQTSLGTGTVAITVVAVNHAPALPAQANRTIASQSPLVVTNAATDTDLPSQVLTYQLLSGPAGASLDSNGVITWTPAAGQVPSTNLFTTKVTDTGSPPLSATNSFTVFVTYPAAVVLDSTVLVAEGSLPTNNAIDPGETVMVAVALKNTGLGDTINLVATLLQTNGVLAPSGPQSYGVLSAGGAAVTQAFSLTAAGTCGGTITATLQLQDGALNLGTAAVVLQLGQTGTVFTQSFDAVTRPALPPGWTTSASNAQSGWVTTNSLADTAPNTAYSIDATTASINELVSPPILLALGQAQLSFRHHYAFEADSLLATNAYDGGVLEIKIGTNVFTDITNAGSGVVNGYNRKIDTRFGNPLAGRWAWSATNSGFVTTTVTLPPAAAGQTIQLRWRAGSDSGVGGGGWWVDSIAITGNVCAAPDPPRPVIQSITVSTDAVIINWSAVVGRSYRLRSRDTQVPTNWVDVPPDVAATGPGISATNAVSGSALRIYRVLLLP